MKRKTYTSCEVKDRWNRAHYDRIDFRAPKGSADEVKAIAEKRGMSVAAYMRHLIIADNSENPDSTRFLRGGGVAEPWTRLINVPDSQFNRTYREVINECDGEDPGQLWL